MDTKQSTLNIAAMARARAAVHFGAFIVGLVTYIEIAITIALAADASAVATIAAALVIAQIIILRVGRSAFIHASKEPWRANTFIALALLFFIVASAALDDEIWPVYFLVLSAVLAYPSVKALRALATIRQEMRTAADPAFMVDWLFPDRSNRLKPGIGRERLPRAAPWFALAVGAVVLLPALHGLGIVRFEVGGFVGASLMIGAFFVHRGRRHLKLRAAELRIRDQRPPVLILRSFKDDKLAMNGRLSRLRGFALRPTLEEVAAHEAAFLGPTITIGEPGEKLPPLGAAREYLAHEDWQTAVGALIAEAALIVFILGDTENLFWEFATTIEKRGKDPLLIVVPPMRNQADLERRWQRFAEANAQLLGADFPRHLPDGPVVAFYFREHRPVLIFGRKRHWWEYTLGIRLAILLRERLQQNTSSCQPAQIQCVIDSRDLSF